MNPKTMLLNISLPDGPHLVFWYIYHLWLFNVAFLVQHGKVHVVLEL